MKKISLILFFITIGLVCLAQANSGFEFMENELSSTKYSAYFIGKALSGIGAAIGLINIARKGLMEDGNTAGSLMKWILLASLSAAVFTVLLTVY